jgi:hypothetical protein
MARLHNVTEMMLGCRTQAQVHIPEIFFPPEPLTMLLSTMAGRSLRSLAIAIQLETPTNEVTKALETMPPVLGDCAKWGEIDQILDDSEGYPVLHEVYLIFDSSWSDDTILPPNSLSNIKDRVKSCFPKLIASRRLHLRQ